MPASWVIKTAKELGFDGVELLASKPVMRNFDALRIMVAERDLELHVHQAWSYEESNAPSLPTRIMEKIGYLPRTRRSLSLLPGNRDVAKIVYANCLDSEYAGRPDFWFQTCPMRSGDTHAITHGEFVDGWCRFPVPICWDFQHSLEWQTGSTMNPGNFAHLHPEQLEKILFEDFKCYRDYIRQIHWTDSDPSRGHKGLNVMPGTGVLARTGIMKNLCKTIVASGWTGCVVPEVGLQGEVIKSPWRLKDTLARIKDKAEEAFS